MMKTLIRIGCAAFMIAASSLAGASDHTLAATPPMGWNSWNHFACKVTAADVRGAADAIAGNGMKDAGYIYVNIDDCWQGTRDDQGRIRPNEKFGDMKALVGYVHSKGLKIGIYSSPGPKTCAGYEGSYRHEEQDAQQYADWGFDYLKYDWCSAEKVYQRSQMIDVYKKMHDALARTGRPIVFSLCQYGYGVCGDGARLWVEICGARPKTLTITTIACPSSDSIRTGWSRLPARGAGTIPTCSKSATAA